MVKRGIPGWSKRATGLSCDRQGRVMKILYEDPQIIVCYKESGLPVQSARIGTKDMVSLLKNYLWEQGGKKKEPYLGVVHRLDQPVEGVLVFARTPEAAKELSRQISDGNMRKMYRAVVRKTKEGIPEEGILTDFLLKDGKTNSSRVVSKGTAGAKKAILKYQILDCPEEGKMLAGIELHTGRHHQIRVQMANAGMPLLGDRKYGSSKREEIGGQLALCAVSLSFSHPKTGKKMEFSCKPQGTYFQIFDAY